MPTVRERYEEAREHILQAALQDGDLVVIANSPPGAGKTHLVESLAAGAVNLYDLRVAIATPRAQQQYDLLARIHRGFTVPSIVGLYSSSRQPPANLSMITMGSDPLALPIGPGIVVSTASKLASSATRLSANQFDLLIFDEAYQLPGKEFSKLAHLAPSYVLIGDPGQLPPIVKSDTRRLENSRHPLHIPAPEYLSGLHPGIRTFSLPATRRFLQDTVDFIQPAFYEDLPFNSLLADAERQLSLGAAGMGDPIDRAIDMVANGCGLVLLLLPDEELPLDELDEGVSVVMGQVAQRILQRQPSWVGRRRLTSGDVGLVDPHVQSSGVARRFLRNAGLPEIMVNTPEVWQGGERPLMVVRHPLSGKHVLDPFALEPGRWCVMLSRHQLGCIIVGRDGIDRAIGEHVHDCGVAASGAKDISWRGFQAHQRIYERLERLGRVVRM